MGNANRPREIRLSTTPTPEALAELRLGDIVYLDGLMYTAREGVYMRALEDTANIPMELPGQSAANFHCSTVGRCPDVPPSQTANRCASSTDTLKTGSAPSETPKWTIPTCAPFSHLGF